MHPFQPFSRIWITVFVGLLLAAAGPAEAISCLLVPLACVKPHRKYGEEKK